jgi:hypothetical protein
VLPEDVRWEESRGAVLDTSSGRFVLFLASQEPGAPRDVWRARVRVSPEGRPMEVVDAHNLTSTPLGDDHALVLRGQYAAFATQAMGQESVSALDLSGEGAQNKAEKLSDKMMSFVTNVQRTGTGAGVGRIDVNFENQVRSVGLALGETQLEIDVVDDGGRRRAWLDLARGEMTGTSQGAEAQASAHLPKRFSHWAVDTVRAVSWIGPEPIAWLEEKVFGARDFAKQLAFKVKGSSGKLAEVLGSLARDRPLAAGEHHSDLERARSGRRGLEIPRAPVAAQSTGDRRHRAEPVLSNLRSP